MSIENEIAGLTQSTTDLLEAVNTKKATLDTAVSNAQTAVTDATSQVSLAAAEKVGAQTARDTAESFKDQAYTYSQSAASAVAYQDLTAIAQTKSETAVDVFVYDTSKDSDGGAWRKRTQHTSWYNETLNTATRGSRKEFPAVAVIVALSDGDQIRIYDGDDPSLPMWMIITNTLGGAGHTGTKTSVSAINGKVVFGILVQQGLRGLDFVSDTIFGYKESVNAGASGVSPNPISLRNEVVDVNDWSKGYPALVSPDINDVAMTVLPDAPIDPATGLPIPTIAVATDGGVSVIKDDGTVVDWLTNSGDMYTVSVSEDESLVATGGGGIAFYTWGLTYIPSSDSNDYSWITYYNWGDNKIVRQGSAGNSQLTKTQLTKHGMAFYESSGISTNNKLFLVDSIKNLVGYNSTAHITSEYNTGWMNGDIKLATLSDTDDTDLVGSELVTNGTFDTDTSGWTATSNASLSVVNNRLRTTSTAAGYEKAFQDIAVEIGKTYVITANVYWVSGDVGWIAVGDGATENINLTRVTQSSPEEGIYITHTATTNVIKIKAQTHNANVGDAVDIDNISVRLAEPDRSVNNNGLQVFGTVQKSPVATGADLVAYSGFSPSNYLEQPYNPDLDFGTGDFCVMGWVSRLTGDMTILYTGTTNVDGINIWGYNEALKIRVGGVPLNVGHDTGDGFSFITVMRKSGVVYIYINGALKASVSAPNTINYNGFKVGTGFFASSFSDFKLALLRISATAPTAEQVAKIYRDEKPLFQENAKATLHGTSDAVTALAYDEDTELLHVGTSSGRSVFQGLKRVDNTTDAVGTAISASNNLVVEE